MAGLIGNGVTLQGLVPQDFLATWNISGTVDRSTDIGKAVSIDATAANTAKLCADDAVILGILPSSEDGKQKGIKVGPVVNKGFSKVPYLIGVMNLVPFVGNSLRVWATAGKFNPFA